MQQKEIPELRDTRTTYSISTWRTRPHDTHTHKNPNEKEIKGEATVNPPRATGILFKWCICFTLPLTSVIFLDV